MNNPLLSRIDETDLLLPIKMRLGLNFHFCLKKKKQNGKDLLFLEANGMALTLFLSGERICF